MPKTTKQIALGRAVGQKSLQTIYATGPLLLLLIINILFIEKLALPNDVKCMLLLVFCG